MRIAASVLIALALLQSVPAAAAPLACMAPETAMRLEEMLRDGDTLRAKWEAAEAERVQLRAEVAALREVDAKNREALIRADEREKVRGEQLAPLKAALETNVATMGHTVELIKAQQAEIESLRKERLWYAIFGGLAGIALGVIAVMR